MDYSISKTNQYSLLCDLNKIPLKVMLLETQNLNCNSSVVEQVCNNLESIAFKARDIVNATKDGQDLQGYSDFDDCDVKISNDSKLYMIEYQSQKIPILSLIMLTLSSASILLLIFNDKFNYTKETST